MLRHDEVQLLAYRFWQERGSPLGTPEVDWFRAEAESGATKGRAETPLSALAKTVGSALGSVAALVTSEN